MVFVAPIVSVSHDDDDDDDDDGGDDDDVWVWKPYHTINACA